MNYQASKPTAHISVHRNRLSHRKPGQAASIPVVHMDNGTNFQIELNNFANETVLAKIKVNGKPIGSAGLVLRPGEHVYLERFLDTKNKFVFETYEVDDVNEVRNAIKNNGVVEVQFFKEQPNFYTPVTTWTYDYYGGPNYGSSGGVLRDITRGTTRSLVGMSNTGGATLSSTISCNTLNVEGAMTFTSQDVSVPEQMETGRVEKGEHSDQKFTNVNMSFNSWAFKTDTIHILPTSRIVSTSDVRDYCSECGKRFKRADHFCSKCGYKR